MSETNGMGRTAKQVRIVSVTPSEAWYTGLVGEIFNVYRWGRDFVLAEDYDAGQSAIWRHIEADDAVLVN